MELSQENAIDYLRKAGRASAEGEILVQKLPGDERPGGNVVLKVFDTTAGEKIGTDLRTESQKKLGKPDLRPTQGHCFVVKQPRAAAGGGIDLARICIERACMDLLGNLLPEHSVPAVQWYDEAEGILAMTCAPLDAVVWRKQLGQGVVSMDAATHTGMLLAMLHSSTKKDPAVKEKFNDSRVLLPGRLDPAIRAAASRHVPLVRMLQDAALRVKSPLCLIHGDYSTENILVVPAPAEEATLGGKPKAAGSISQVMIVDFETACFGHNAFDVATILSDMLLIGFLRGAKWRAFMMMADNFWQTYRHTADPELVRAAEVAGGRILGALLLARIDGNEPVKEFLDRKEAQAKVRKLATEILKRPTISLDEAIDEASMHYDDSD